MVGEGVGVRLESLTSSISLSVQIPHIKVGPEETPRLQYLRFASVSLYPSNEDVSLAVSRILKSFNYPSASLICAKAECERGLGLLPSFSLGTLPKSPCVPQGSPVQQEPGSSSSHCVFPLQELGYLLPWTTCPSCPRETHVTMNSFCPALIGLSG